jgi:aspartyl-tRNA(Asn)/glutamyl-tRNA(Gln) amidotransferase subunit C
MSKITSDDVIHVAKLARLKLTDDEVALYTTQLEAILEHASSISALDTEGIEPTAHPLAKSNVFRKDEVRPSLSQEEVLSNAPAAEDGRFKVPQILETEQ